MNCFMVIKFALSCKVLTEMALHITESDKIYRYLEREIFLVSIMSLCM